MRLALHRIVYLPALLGWLIFAPAFRAANWLVPNSGRYALWFWCGIEAKCHSTYYDVYGDPMNEESSAP